MCLLNIYPFLIFFTVLFVYLDANIYKSVDGRTVEGQVLDIEDNYVVFLRQRDNKEFRVSLSVFSEEDQKRITLKFTDKFWMPPLKENPQLLLHADQIDQILYAHWNKNRLKGQPFVSDTVFLRRAYLKIIGRIPNVDEVRSFLESKSRTKRSQLINKLLMHYGYVLGEFSFWADLLRVRTDIIENEGSSYVQWIKEQIRKNVPYDNWVREMLLARGDIINNPASGYYLTDLQMPLDNLAYTMEIFAGTAVGCAQCHDHPFEQWTQKQFYELASFRYKINTRSILEPLASLRKEIKKVQKPERDKNNRFFLGKTFYIKQYGVTRSEKRNLRFPADYQYSTRLQNQEVDPKLLYQIKGKSFHSSEDPLVDWLTHPTNDKFVWTISNRIWQKVMGASLFPNPQNFSKPDEANIPELISYLGKLMKTLKFDIKQFYRVLYNTKFFQRKTIHFSPEQIITFGWQGPIFKRMSPEQVWDSMVGLVIPNVDFRLGSYHQLETTGDLTNKLFNFPVKKLVKEIEKLDYGVRNYRGARHQLYEALDIPWQPMRTQIRQKSRQVHPYWDDFDENMVRSAELQSPSKPSHILRSFGQSDRILINRSSNSPNLTQILALLNSNIINDSIIQKSFVLKKIESYENFQDKLDHIFLMVLNRYPNEAEKEKFLPYLKSYPEEGSKDILWALCNSPHFLFIL